MTDNTKIILSRVGLLALALSTFCLGLSWFWYPYPAENPTKLDIVLQTITILLDLAWIPILFLGLGLSVEKLWKKAKTPLRRPPPRPTTF